MGIARWFVTTRLAIIGITMAATLAAHKPVIYSAHVVGYHATNDNVKYNYCVVLARGARHPGTSSRRTHSIASATIKKPGDTREMVKGDNPLTGPFYMDGAQPGDTLVVKILDLQVDGNQGMGAFAPGFGALERNQTTPRCSSAAAGKDLVLSHRQGEQHGDVPGAGFEVFRQDTAASILRMYRSGAGRRRGRGARLCRRSSAAIWTRPKSAWAILCIFR